ncbi:MAG: YciI family protein [Hyphomicrobiales bacterium]
MLFAVLFTDNPEHADARRRLMPAHLDFLERHSDEIRAAGPLQEAVSGEAAGGMWLVEAESAEAVGRLYRSDPLWPTGLRRSARVLRWTQVFAEGRRMTEG